MFKRIIIGLVATCAIVGMLYNAGLPNQVTVEEVPESIKTQFAAWKVEYGKDQLMGYEHDNGRKLNNFWNNVKLIEQHNSEDHTYTLGMNQFGDLSLEEYREAHLGGYKKSQENMRKNKQPQQPVEFVGDVPAAVDWVTAGGVNPVQNQGSCGSCWAFSATAALEGAYYVRNKKLLKFAESLLVDCDTVDNGCQGGLMDNAFRFYELHEAVLETQMPYSPYQGACKTLAGVSGTMTSGFVDIAHDSVLAMKQALVLQPVSVAIEADQQKFQFYRSGVFSGPCGQSLDHGVVAVGYGTDEVTGETFWKVRNSWGSTWGEQGYIRMNMVYPQQASGMCGILAGNSYPTLA